MPQPIDMLSEIARTSMAERVQDAATRANMAALQRAQEEMEAEHRARETQVTETGETDNREIDANGRKDSRRERQKKKKKPAQNAPGADEASHTFYKAGAKTVIDDPDAHDLDVTV